MRMRIDAAGNYKLSCGVDRSIDLSNNAREVSSNHRNDRAVNEDIADVRINGSHDMTVLDERSHRLAMLYLDARAFKRHAKFPSSLAGRF